VTRILNTAGGQGEQDIWTWILLVSWVSMILDTTGELGEQDIGYYWWVG